MNVKPENPIAAAIPTRYKGYHFRSRLEARWAVFFDEVGIGWEYEEEGYDLGKFGWYLPDFYLKDFGVYVEIKPDKQNCKVSEDEVNKIKNFTELTGHSLMVFVGIPGEHPGRMFTYVWLKGNNYIALYSTPSYFHSWVEDMSSIKTMDDFYNKSPIPHICIIVDDNNGFHNGMFVNRNGTDVTPLENYDTEYLEECSEKINFETIFQFEKAIDKKLIKAYEAARSARFEHGESGAT